MATGAVPDEGLREEPGGEAGDHEVTLTDEIHDAPYPLPEGWPRLQEKLFKRRNLYFLKPTSPSIAKVIHHLQQLQDKIVSWSREVELEILSRRSSELSSLVQGPSYQEGRQGLGSKLSQGRKHLRFISDSAESSGGGSIDDSQSGLSSGASFNDELSIHGTGALIPQDEPLVEIPEEELPKLGAEQVIDEVVTLIGRLEADRQDTETALEKERQRVVWLQAKIDRLAHKRLVELPKAVQKEHEACATDIAELKWHCSYRGRQLSRVQTTVESAEVIHSRLNEDISFVKKHCPLVEEKLDLEGEAIKRIDQAQDETTNELNRMLDKLKKTKNKSHGAHSKADMERAHIKKELNSVRDALTEINHELEEAKGLHTSYVHKCNDLRRKLLSNAQEKVVLESRNESARTAEKLEGQRVKNTQDLIVDSEFEHRRIADLNFQFNLKIDEMREAIKRIQAEADVANTERLKELRHREQRCNEMTMDIDDIEAKLRYCKKQKVADAKNMERIKREMKNVESQLGVVNEEHTKTKVVNVAVKSKLMGEKDKVALKEDQLTMTIDGLTQQHKDESQGRTILQSRILSDTGSYQQQQQDAKRKKGKAAAKCSEIEKVVEGVMSEVMGKRVTKADRMKTVSELEASIAAMKAQHNALERDLKQKLADAEPKSKQLQHGYLETQKTLDYMKAQTGSIQKKLTDQAQSENFMDRVIKNNEEAIKELSADFKEQTIKLEAGRKQEQDLKNSLSDITNRLDRGEEQHIEHIETRKMVLVDLEGQLKDRLQANSNLASEYRLLQQEFYTKKNELLTEFEVRIGLEASLKDHKQLNSLQVRLHDALCRYFTLRGLYNQSKLAGFEESSQENAKRILVLRKEMDGAIDTISRFLSDQLDGTAMKMVKAAADSALREGALQQPSAAMAWT